MTRPYGAIGPASRRSIPRAKRLEPSEGPVSSATPAAGSATSGASSPRAYDVVAATQKVYSGRVEMGTDPTVIEVGDNINVRRPKCVSSAGHELPPVNVMSL